METRSARLRSARERCCVPRRVIVSRRTAPGWLTPSVAGVPVPHVAHADQELDPVRQVQRPLGVPAARAQAVIRLRLRPPAVVLGVPEREHLPHVPAERGVRGDAGEPRGRPVEDRDLAVVVRDHQAVGQVIGVDQPVAGLPGRRGGPAGALPGGAGGAGRGREGIDAPPGRTGSAGRRREGIARCPGRLARHDPVHSNAASARPVPAGHCPRGAVLAGPRFGGIPQAGFAAPASGRR